MAVCLSAGRTNAVGWRLHSLHSPANSLVCWCYSVFSRDSADVSGHASGFLRGLPSLTFRNRPSHSRRQVDSVRPVLSWPFPSFSVGRHCSMPCAVLCTVYKTAPALGRFLSPCILWRCAFLRSIRIALRHRTGVRCGRIHGIYSTA
jgi:hypothetical protein